MADTGEMDGERRAPAARADHRDRSHQMRAPMRRSVPARSRSTLDRCRNTMMAEAAHAAPTAAAELPVRYASGGNAMEAMSEPSEMYFVIHTTARNSANAGGAASGVKTEKTPQAVATPLPPRNRTHTG